MTLCTKMVCLDIWLSFQTNIQLGEGRILCVPSYLKTTGRQAKFSFQCQGVLATIVDADCANKVPRTFFIKNVELQKILIFGTELQSAVNLKVIIASVELG